MATFCLLHCCKIISVVGTLADTISSCCLLHCCKIISIVGTLADTISSCCLLHCCKIISIVGTLADTISSCCLLHCCKIISIVGALADTISSCLSNRCFGSKPNKMTQAPSSSIALGVTNSHKTSNNQPTPSLLGQQRDELPRLTGHASSPRSSSTCVKLHRLAVHLPVSHFIASQFIYLCHVTSIQVSSCRQFISPAGRNRLFRHSAPLKERNPSMQTLESANSFREVTT